MTYLQHKDSRQKQMSTLFEKHEVFFAFSRSQIEAEKKEGVKYYSLEGGMFIPQANYDAFNAEYEEQENAYMQEAKEKFSATEIISYELANHEYCYTYDLTDTKGALEEFGFSDKEYRVAVKDYLSKSEEV